MRIKEGKIILQECKFFWTEAEINQALSLFSKGIKPTVVAEVMNESVVDIALLLIHLVDKGEV